jgi:8-oxo-dGTP pyrophosphatase MutT (NUDIX family)
VSESHSPRLRPMHADAVNTLTAFAPPDPGQEALRSHYLDLLRRRPGAVAREDGPEHLTASALVVDATGERTLLALHRKGGMWVQLGGHIEEHDQTLAGAALREAREESGIADLRLVVDVPVDLDRHELGPAFGRCATHCDVRYVVVAPPGAVEGVSPESLELRWFAWDALPTEAVPDLSHLIEGARRVLALQRFP